MKIKPQEFGIFFCEILTDKRNSTIHLLCAVNFPKLIVIIDYKTEHKWRIIFIKLSKNRVKSLYVEGICFACKIHNRILKSNKNQNYRKQAEKVHNQEHWERNACDVTNQKWTIEGT